MRHVKNVLLVLFTLLLVAVGAFMPLAASELEDAYGANKSETWVFDSFSLTLKQEADLGRILRVVENGSYYVHEASKSSSALLTEGLALEAAENVLTELVEYGLIDKAVWAELLDPRVQAQEIFPMGIDEPLLTEEERLQLEKEGLVLPYDAGNSASTDWNVEEGEAIPAWTVIWNRPDYFYIWVDDASGKAIQISTFLGQELATAQEAVNVAEKWVRFLGDYYGVEVTRSSAYWYDDDSVAFLLSFPLGENEEQFYMTLYLFPDGYVTMYPWADFPTN